MNWDWLYTDWAPWAELAGSAALIAVVAWWGERRRMRRSDPDAVGFMPWGTVFVLALFVLLIAAVFILRYAL
ncbi:MAG: hypothetical protein ACK44O_07540 [Novosphingobium sp.]|uniref:hypothetical protein n=1 Tax=Novosphingobium sp. TaxID=1874826 RepID=UPI003918A75E|nr:hypothetical protein [Novosphingobium sp.]